jgi:8-oxo-dGTP pyrophosphatase MutT (NUDIX family)
MDTNRVVSAIVLNGKHEVLVGKIRDDRLPDFGGIAFIFPGGKVKANESFEDAAKREVFEEASLYVTPVGVIGTRFHPITKREIFYVYCRIEDNDASPYAGENEDIEQLLWVKIDNLKMLLPTLNPQVIEYLQKLNNEPEGSLL